MKRTFASILATASILSLATPALALTAYPDGAVYVRSGPGTSYSVLELLQDGQKAAILSHDGSWFKVRTDDGTVGYMADWVTREVFDDETLYLKVNTDYLHVRTEPSVSATALGLVTQDQQFPLLEQEGDWVKIDAGSIGKGWVMAQYTIQVSGAAQTPPAQTPPAQQPPTAPPPATTPPSTPPPDNGGPRPGLIKDVAAARATSILNGRSTEYDEVASVRAGESLTYLDSAEGWVKVMNANGDSGWVNGTDLYLWDRGINFANQATYTVAENDWEMNYLRVRAVTDNGAGLLVRTGPSRDYPSKRSLDAGNLVKLLQVPGGEYVQVLLGDGTVGWVSRNYLRLVPGIPGESAALTQPEPGVERLTLTGSLASSQVSADGTGTALSVSLPANSDRRSALEIAEHGIDAMTMSADRLTIGFEQPVNYEIVSQSASQLVVDIRPLVRTAQLLWGTDRYTYRFQVTGDVEPTAYRDGGSVVINLPGARLAGGAQTPGGISLSSSESGLTGRITSDHAFAIKRGDGYIDLVVYSPGLAGKTIVVDAGHGGSETGAIGLTGLVEKDVNLAVALKVQQLLESAGAKVIMTRTSDSRCATPQQLSLVAPADQLHYDLGCRAAVANTAKADAFVSIHSNANDSTQERGTATYYSADNFNAPESQALASAMEQAMLQALGLPNRGAMEQPFYVIKYTDAPATLVEMAFLTNGADESLLKQDSFRQKAAQGIVQGLQAFFH